MLSLGRGISQQICISAIKRCLSKNKDHVFRECGWEEAVETAICKKEAPRLDVDVEIGDQAAESTRMASVHGEDKRYILNGTPAEYRSLDSAAVISKRTKHVMQQGTNNTHFWELTYPNKERWENPTMGWASSGYSHSNVVLTFPTEKEAIAYAENYGYKWQITTYGNAEKKKFKPKRYGDNFAFKSRTRVSTK